MICVFIVVSCADSTRYHNELTYVVYYPSHNDTVSVTYDGPGGYSFGSDRGTNYITIKFEKGWGYEYNSSAPYKVIHYSKKEIK